MKIHRQGYKIILFTFLVYAVILFLIFYFINNLVLQIAVLAVFIFSFLLVVWFFRSPRRLLKYDENLIYAPADGKVVAIEEVTEEEYFKDKRIQISIFMSPLDVHINYYPVSGTIDYLKYHKGNYLVAWHPKSSISNERSTIVIRSDENRSLLIRQIAGAVARRIVTNAMSGEKVKQGDELGFIRFGSRVDIILPADIKVLTSINSKVRGKKTVIARFGDSAPL
ncbi:MAG: phosphatidylserine decarboxylase family protein [Bacteroidales bacterium]|nr:MAG: phosphatidylserine decarboxylase family protein [Bacteroidales bacterium]